MEKRLETTTECLRGSMADSTKITEIMSTAEAGMSAWRDLGSVKSQTKACGGGRGGDEEI